MKLRWQERSIRYCQSYNLVNCFVNTYKLHHVNRVYNKFCAGDQILAVNEHRLTGLSRNKAIAILRKVEGDVTLLLTRPNMAVAQVNSSNSDKVR